MLRPLQNTGRSDKNQGSRAGSLHIHASKIELGTLLLLDMLHGLLHGVSLALTCAFFLLPAARRYVRSTSAASRRDAERARYKVQVPNIASKAFLNYKRPSLKGLS